MLLNISLGRLFGIKATLPLGNIFFPLQKNHIFWFLPIWETLRTCMHTHTHARTHTYTHTHTHTESKKHYRNISISPFCDQNDLNFIYMYVCFTYLFPKKNFVLLMQLKAIKSDNKKGTIIFSNEQRSWCY